MQIAKKLTLLLAFLVVTACSTNGPMTVDPNASGQLMINATQTKMILGGSTGSGVLNYDGNAHAFSIDGVQLGGVGIDTSHFAGNVYNLNKLEDFQGIYVAADAAANADDGSDGTWMRNDNGVYVHLKTNTSSLKLNLGDAGIKLALE